MQKHGSYDLCFMRVYFLETVLSDPSVVSGMWGKWAAT